MKTRMKTSIFSRIAVYFLAVLLLFTLVLTIVFVSLFRLHETNLQQQHMTEQAFAVAQTLGSYGMHGSAQRRVFGIYRQFLKQIAVTDMWIADRGMNMQCMRTDSSGGNRMHGRNHVPYTESYTAAAQELPQELRQAVAGLLDGSSASFKQRLPPGSAPGFGTAALIVGVPIRDNSGNTAGAALLFSPESSVLSAVTPALHALALGAAAAAAAAAGAAFLLSRRFTRPLVRISETARCLAEGRYGERCGVNDDDEIGLLAADVDSLAGRLEQAEQERKSLDRMRDDFFANISHELRTPAAVLKGSVEMLLSGAVRGETETAEYYAQMQRETEQLSRLINDLLDLSRLQNEQFRLEKETFDLHDVARDAVRAARRIAAPKSVRIVCKSTEKDCTVLGDYGRIRQLLLILLDNAVKFSPEGAEVSLSLIRSQDAVSACVRDNGSGIAPEALPHVFDRFYRASNTERTGGTGLGLAIARQIAERHGAHITAESADGETRFTVAFHVCRLSGE